MKEKAQSVFHLHTRLPDSLVTLGAGSIVASTLITAFISVFSLYLLMVENFTSFSRVELLLSLTQTALLTGGQMVATYLALARRRWTVVMIVICMSSLAILTLPFAVVAFACIGVSRHHFGSLEPAG